jgi:ATP-binding cassette subfamily B (MDR/TAP) protein 1
METLQLKPLIDSMSLDGLKPTDKVTGTIELQNIVFAYPSRPGTIVCNHITLTIESGDSLAFVGASGSGKSTIISLLLRHYDPCAGNIILDGRSLRDLNVRWLRSKIG